jgi:multidrug efflux pump subunit AcrA (membrane-fusion protein)
MRLVPGAQPRPAPEAPAPSSEQEQAEAKARLAAAVAELARHVATTQADERIDAELLDQQMRRDEARRRADDEAAAEQRRRTAGAQQAARATVDGRSQRWVWQVLVAVAVLVPIGLDIRSPIAARARLDGVAGTVATSAAVELSGSGNERFARQVAQGVADLEGVTLEAFSLEGPVVRVTVSDEAGSVLLGRLAPSWYEVERSAEATAVTGR